MDKLKSPHSDDESSTVTPQSKVSRKYENITAAGNARQINGDVIENIHIGDVHNYPSHISMLEMELQQTRRDADYAA
jgi:hypothetical protein